MQQPDGTPRIAADKWHPSTDGRRFGTNVGVSVKYVLARNSMYQNWLGVKGFLARKASSVI
jgi:hypothetical protein